MFDVMMYTGGVYRSQELYELIEDIGGVVLMKSPSAQMLDVTMSIPHEDREIVGELCKDMGGGLKEVPLAGTEIVVVGPTLGRHHMPHPVCDFAEILRRYGALTIVMGIARGRGKLTSQMNLKESSIINEYDACVFMMGNFKSCVETKAEILLPGVHIPLLLVCGPKPDDDKITDYCDAVVTGVGRKAERMRYPDEREKLEEVADRIIELVNSRKQAIQEDPLAVSPSDLKAVLENYEPVDMCLRPAPIAMHLDGVRVKIPYDAYYKEIGNLEVYGRKIADICEVKPSKIDDSSILIKIKTASRVAYEDSLKANKS